jgi:DNA-directed RNA polymerase specialized sigma24 family protein
VDRVPVLALEREWAQLERSLLVGRYREWARDEPALARVSGAGAMVRLLHAAQTSPAEKDEVLCALLRLAREDALAARAVLTALMPGLKSIARRLLVDVRRREDVWQLLLANAWEQIRAYPLERRPRRVAANLLLDTLRGTLAELRRDRHDPRARVCVTQAPCEADVDRLVGHAVEADVLSADEAELILATRIDGVPLAVLAARQDTAYNTLKIRRQRAERRLLLFLGFAPVPRGRQRRPSSVARAAGAGQTPATGNRGSVDTRGGELRPASRAGPEHCYVEIRSEDLHGSRGRQRGRPRGGAGRAGCERP